MVNATKRKPILRLVPKPDGALWGSDVAELMGIKWNSVRKLRSRSRKAPHSPAFPPPDGVDPGVEFGGVAERGPQEWWYRATIDAYRASRPGQIGRPRNPEPPE